MLRAAAAARLLAEERAGEELGRGPTDPGLDAFIGDEVQRHEETRPIEPPAGAVGRR